MKILLVSKNKTIKVILKNYNITISTKYDEIIKLLNNNYDAIILDSFLNLNILKILNEYTNEDNYRKTIIIDNIRLFSYSMLKNNKQVYAIIDNINLDNNLLY